MIVVDSNVLAYLYLPGDRMADAEALLELDPDWAAPVLWPSEFRNILAGYLRRKTITFDQACSLQNQAESLLPGRNSTSSRRPFWNWFATATARHMTASSSHSPSSSTPNL